MGATKAISGIKKAVSSDDFIARLITVLLSLMTSGIMLIVVFIWDLRGDVPVLKTNYQSVTGAIGTLQGSVNVYRMDISEINAMQARLDERLKSLERKNP